MIEVKPTRSELIKLRKRIKLAIGGHSLLKRKRDGMIQEFFTVYEKSKETQTELSKQYQEAIEKIAVAKAVDGTIAVKSASQSLKTRPEIELKTKNVMGVIVPEVGFEKTQKKMYERGYGMMNTSARIDEAADSYELVLDNVITAAEIETTMRRLLLEIEKTKRRVNALEYVVIPNLEQSANFIELRLGEMEREDIFRLKKIKRGKNK